MPHEFIYSAYKLARHYPPDRTVLEDISLSFYPGAKIGVIGSNGAGKSSLLRIMAGLDDGFTGEARLTPGFTVGYLSQEPELDPTKDVKGNVMDGVAEVQALIDQYNAVMAKWSDPDADYEAIGAEQAALEDKIAAADAWNLERNVDIAMDALRCPPDDADVAPCPAARSAASRCAGCCSSHPDLLLLDEPTNHLDAESVDWLERFLQEYSGTVVAITHDRYFLDNVAQWILELDRGRGIPFEGNYSSWLEQKLERLASEERPQRSPPADARPRARMGAPGAQGSAGEGQGPPRRLREAAGRGASRQGAAPRARDRHPARPPPRRHGHRGQEPAQGLRRPAADRGPDVLAAEGRDRRDHRRERRRQDHPVPDARGPGGARCRHHHDRRHRPSSPAWTGAATPPRRQEGLPRDHARRRGREGRQPRASGPGVCLLVFRGTDQQKLVGALSGGERNRVHLAKLLQSGGNVLLLDEPTNDLDVDTLRARDRP